MSEMGAHLADTADPERERRLWRRRSGKSGVLRSGLARHSRPPRRKSLTVGNRKRKQTWRLPNLDPPQQLVLDRRVQQELRNILAKTVRILDELSTQMKTFGRPGRYSARSQAERMGHDSDSRAESLAVKQRFFYVVRNLRDTTLSITSLLFYGLALQLIFTHVRGIQPSSCVPRRRT